ncbi:MAG: DegT/DnrJ/EryC1/StrS family aminotransferase [Halobacteriovoraceae bacterium]|nr:DegT/DnrJ/EryC1/StrS family aminotransferase [Halobacteriovoraceae bacterium]
MKDKVKNYFINRFQNENIILFSRVNSLFWGILKSLPKKKYVVLPSTLCLSPLFVIQHLGYEPLFIDTNLKTGQIDLADFKTKISKHFSEISLVLCAHLLGIKSPIEEVVKFCSNYKIPVIEDSAQAMPEEGYKSCADYFLLSFGHTKIIDCGHGGMLITKDLPTKQEVLNQISEIRTELDDNLRELSINYRKEYYEYFNNKEFFKLGEFYKKYFPLILVNDSHVDWNRIYNQLQNLDTLIKNRIINTEIYDESFEKLPISVIRKYEQWPLWRYSFLCDELHRDELISELRLKSLDVSSWYPSLNSFIQNGHFETPMATEFQNRVVNLWVDYADQNTTRKVADVVRKYFS